MVRTYSRREFLNRYSKMLTFLAPSLALGGITPFAHGASRRISSLQADPFTLGVASGDPTPDAVILWSRLDREVLKEAGHEDQAIQVDYEISESSNFQQIAKLAEKMQGLVKSLMPMFGNRHFGVALHNCTIQAMD